MRALVGWVARRPWLWPLAAVVFFTAVSLTMLAIAEAHPPEMLPGR